MSLSLFIVGCKQGLHFFEKFQGIPTKGAADVKLFSVGYDLFLVFANYYGDKSGHKAKSVAYKMENKRFILNQTLSTHGAYGIENFKIDGVHYMAIANQYDGGYKQNSIIYKWSKGKFEEFHVISTKIQDSRFFIFALFISLTTVKIKNRKEKIKRT